jgi:hypothetical protein
MFPSGTFRSPNLHAPRHCAGLSPRVPLSVVKPQFKLATSTAHPRALSLYNSLVPRSFAQRLNRNLPAAAVLSRRRTFSNTAAVNMPATKIDGTAIAKDIREKLKNEIADLQAKNDRFKPNLVIYQGTSLDRLEVSRANNHIVADRSDSSTCEL